MEVLKRDGSIAPFDRSRICNAVSKALQSVGMPAPMVAECVTTDVIYVLNKEQPEAPVGVEHIQDVVEKALMKRGCTAAAKAYILYRDERRRKRENQLDIKELIEGYINGTDWRVHENANASESYASLQKFVSGSVLANYGLSEIYPEDIKRLHKDGDMHIHDLSGPLIGYCAGYSLRDLLLEGLHGTPDKAASKPPKYLLPALQQAANFLCTLQAEWNGAQAFSSFDTYMAPFIRVNEETGQVCSTPQLSYKKVKQYVQTFLFYLNAPCRSGEQTFSNITMDLVPPPDLADVPVIIGGKYVDGLYYRDCVREMEMINNAFIDLMSEGDGMGKSFSFPIPTYNITRDFPWDSPLADKLFALTGKYGTPYFQNFVNSDIKPEDTRSMCPMRGDQHVLVTDDYSKSFHIAPIKNLYNGGKKENEYGVILNGEVHRVRINRFDNLRFKKVRLVNGHEMELSDNHMNLVLGGGIKRTDELTTDDYLPFNTTVMEGVGLSYDDGYMVGAFMGDGSMKDDYTVTYCLNDSTKLPVMSKIIDLSVHKFGAKYSLTTNNMVNITSRMLRGLIEEYVSGTALTKALSPKCISRSADFRKGILDGLLATDGNSEKHRIYTASEDAVETICAMLASLGLPTNVRRDDRGVSRGCLSDNTVYCIRWYSVTSGQPSYKGVYRKEGEYMWFKVESITDVPQASVGYCFEVLNDDVPYFMLPNGLVTHNCRLRLDMKALRKKTGALFGNGENTGSVAVATINLPCIGYVHKGDEAGFFERLDYMMDKASEATEIRRSACQKSLDGGLLPYTKIYVKSLDNHFNTIGLIGMNECCLNYMGKSIADPDGKAFAIKVLRHMLDRISIYQESTGHLYNLEAVPGEGAGHRLAKADRKRYPGIITAGVSAPYYTNSTWLPVGYTDDIFELLDHQDELQCLYTGGTVVHVFLGEAIDGEACKRLVKTITDNYRLPAFTITPTYSICPVHGYIKGAHTTCPMCK